MTHTEFKKEVYDLAFFNDTLSKGYRVEKTQNDLDGYVYKSNRLAELVAIAIKNSFPVSYDGREGVVYFFFGEVQISFHIGEMFAPREHCGLHHCEVEWDGVKKAHLYTEAEYVRLREYRKEELTKRKLILAEKEQELKNIVEKEISLMRKNLKRCKKEATIKWYEKEISYLSEASLYSIVTTRGWISPLCREMERMYRDSYITSFCV